MSAEFLLEIGCEELPAGFLQGAIAALPKLTEDALKRARIAHGAITAEGTPRRLTLRVADIAKTQSDLSEQVLGPPTRIALDAEGAPTKAGLGFAKKQGVAADALFVVDTAKGAYVAVRREETGGPTKAALEQILPGLCAAIPFKKSMRWSDQATAFGRPVRWLVSLLDGDVVDFEFAGCTAGRTTTGHRFLAPALIELADVAAYAPAMAGAHVVVSGEARRSDQVEALGEAATKMGGEVVPDPFLVDECADLVEKPFVVPGSFDDEFLALPDRVIILVMRDHQRYFAVRGPDGKLLPRYLNVVNTALKPEKIAKGNDRVLRARLKDAAFFVREDQKVPIDEWVERLKKVVFQKKLGTIHEKVSRVAALAKRVNESESLGIDPVLIDRGAMLMKADLVSLIVGEFGELQGEMGRHFALHHGEDQAVATAIEEHYLPKGSGGALPETELGSLLALCDRADTLAGCFAIGLSPSGSADPYALRRAAIGVIRLSLHGKLHVDIRGLLSDAHDVLVKDGKVEANKGKEELEAFVLGRLRSLFGAEHEGDVVAAGLGAWGAGTKWMPRSLDARLAAVSALKGEAGFDDLAELFKRCQNITKDWTNTEFDSALCVDAAERALAADWSERQAKVDRAVSNGDFKGALASVAELRAPIARFFDDVLVMAEDAKLKENRLSLLRSIASSVTSVVHFQLLSTSAAART